VRRAKGGIATGDATEMVKLRPKLKSTVQEDDHLQKKHPQKGHSGK